jgi:hypothetical protein
MLRISAAAALAALSTTAAAGTIHYDTYNGRDYAFVTSQDDFDGAQAACEAIGMDLVSLNTFAEQDWVIERAFEATPDNAHAGYINSWIWVGAVNNNVDSSYDVYDAINDSGWEWVSGHLMTITDFDGSMDYDAWNLDNHGAAVTITGPWTEGAFGPGHEWRISPASYSRAYVCEESRARFPLFQSGPSILP